MGNLGEILSVSTAWDDSFLATDRKEVPVSNIANLIPADNEIRFFLRDRPVFGFLSNFHDAAIVVEGETWRSTEFYYQAQKSFDREYRAAIRQATSPGHAKRLSSDPTQSTRNRKCSWFTGRLEKLRGDWAEVKLDVMRVAVRAKFTQHDDLREMLLATGTAPIIEDSKYDSYWGIGRNGDGANHLGQLLMSLRGELAVCQAGAALGG